MTSRPPVRPHQQARNHNRGRGAGAMRSCHPPKPTCAAQIQRGRGIHHAVVTSDLCLRPASCTRRLTNRVMDGLQWVTPPPSNTTGLQNIYWSEPNSTVSSFIPHLYFQRLSLYPNTHLAGFLSLFRCFLLTEHLQVNKLEELYGREHLREPGLRPAHGPGGSAGLISLCCRKPFCSSRLAGGDPSPLQGLK